MNRRPIDADFLEKRMDSIGEGLKEGVRREVMRLRKLGLPIYVQENGEVIDLRDKTATPEE